MAAQHTELENRCVCAHVFVFIFIAVSLISMYSDIITSGKEYPQFYTNHLAFWLEISDFCTGLPYAVLLERPNSYKSASVSRSVVWLFVTPQTVAYRIPLSMEFSRQECWSGLQLPSPGNQTWVWATRQGQLLEKWKSDLWDITSHLSQWLLPKSLQMTNFGKDVEKREPYTLWPSHVKNLLIGKDPDVGKDWRQEEKGTTEDKMFGWHH